jgi:hypothetical protein
MEDHGLSAVRKCTFGVHEVFFIISWGHIKTWWQLAELTLVIQFFFVRLCHGHKYWNNLWRFEITYVFMVEGNIRFCITVGTCLPNNHTFIFFRLLICQRDKNVTLRYNVDLCKVQLGWCVCLLTANCIDKVIFTYCTALLLARQDNYCRVIAQYGARRCCTYEHIHTSFPSLPVSLIIWSLAVTVWTVSSSI